jgi:glutathione S-transferase
MRVSLVEPVTVKLYGMTGSGNCWKPAALMKQLGIAFDWIEIDLLNGQSRTPEFLAKNANGKVPLLEVAPGQLLAESNAMLCYLAEGTPYLPSDRWQRAKVMEWLFFEQYSHEPYIATVRWWVHFLNKQDEWREKIAEAMKKGNAALGVMEAQLTRTPFLAGKDYTIADTALYAYTHVADQGGYDLKRFPAVSAWLARVAAQPRFQSMVAQ